MDQTKRINPWQVLGAVLLIIGAIGYIYEHYFAGTKSPATAPAPQSMVMPASSVSPCPTPLAMLAID